MSELEGGVVGNGEELLLANLKKLTKECEEEESSCRPNLDLQIFLDAATLVRKHVGNEEETQIIGQDAFSVMTHTFRFLRNAIAACKRNQDLIREQTDIIITSNKVLNYVTRSISNVENTDSSDKSSDLEVKIATSRCILQFLMNFMVGNVDNARVISSSSMTSIWELLKRTDDEKSIQYAAMNFHTLLKLIPSAQAELDIGIVPVILENAHLEFPMYLIETLVTHDQFLTRSYPVLSAEHCVKLLRVIIDHTDVHNKFPCTIVTFFSRQFKQKSDLILKSQLENDDWTAWEIVSLLELLCCLSSIDESILTSDASLLTTTIFLLKSVHSIGKVANTDASGSLDFAPVTNIDEMKCSSTTEEMRSRPSFQFKAHLIRLIANLTHQNFLNQEMLRETEILPVILESCSIDARNPFITQWSVLAIRNACEGNPANQELVRSVQQIDTNNKLSEVQLIGL